MGNLQTQKSALAKLMATENLTVQHAKTYTASFDPKNRILTIPIWEKTSAELYDLLVGHEVGHAIDTPADGWHGAVHNNGRNYRAFLNVVEDARIEKRQKRRYPGLRRSFVIGFEELMGRDFFGLEGRDINGMSFIDRLNVYTKSGYTMNTIEFKNEKEEDFVERTKHLETWDDVLKLTNEIWDYSKDEQFELNLPEDYEIQIEVQMDDGDDGGGNGESDTESDTESDGESDGESDTETDGEGNQKSKAKANGNGEEGDGDSGSSSSSKKETKDGDEKDGKQQSQSINRQKESTPVKSNQEPVCETDDNYRRNEMLLVDKNAKDYIYVSPPTPIMKNIITPVKRVQQLLTQEFSEQNDNYEKIANRLYSEYRRRNERFISLLAKEFEMRKAASKFAKSKTSETGDLDVGKIFKYQIDDNIFKRIMKVPKGKSHGLVLLLDKSGSMSDNLSASYEQILILASFCRKVNIPFTAYGFGNEESVYELDNYGKQSRNETNFSAKAGEIKLRKVYLREMINSKMGTGEFNRALKNILCLSDAWKRGYYGSHNEMLCVPPSDSLSNTPLNEALVAIQQILNDFRTENKLDIVNLCIVHDGDADDTSSYIKSDLSNAWMAVRHDNIVLVDKKHRIQIPLVHGNEPMRVALCDWLTRTTGAKVIGFFIAPVGSLRSSLRRRLYNQEMETAIADSKKRRNEDAINEVLSKYSKIVRKEKFVESKNPGYESFFILPGDNDMSVTDDEFESDSVTTAGLTKDFAKFNKARQVSRVLVNRFIGIIAV